MKFLFRLLLTFVSAISTFYFVYWVGGALLLSVSLSPWIPFLASLLIAIVVARYVWLHTASLQAGLVSSVVLGALVTGGVGFSVGFFGPIIFTPQSNQGPLLGIFITGPLGFLLGAVGGAIYWFARRRRAGKTLEQGTG
jgi:hypothetical protein